MNKYFGKMYLYVAVLISPLYSGCSNEFAGKNNQFQDAADESGNPTNNNESKDNQFMSNPDSQSSDFKAGYDTNLPNDNFGDGEDFEKENPDLIGGNGEDDLTIEAAIMYQFVSSRASWTNCLTIQNLSIQGSETIQLGCNKGDRKNNVSIRALAPPACNKIRLTFTSNGRKNVGSDESNWRRKMDYRWLNTSKLQVGLDDDGNRQNAGNNGGFNDFILTLSRPDNVKFELENGVLPCI